MKMTIRTRLLAGCATLLVVIAVACTYGLYQMYSAEQSIGDIADRSTENIRRLDAATAATAGLLTARRHDAQFRLTKQPGEIDAARASLDATRASLRNIVAEAPAGDPLQAPVKAALASADRYENSINTLSDLLTKRGLKPDLGIEGELRKSVHSIETLVNEQGLAELSVLLLMCRRHEKDYLLRGDPKYLNDIGKRIAEFADQMNLFSLPPDVQSKVNAAWKTYHANMKAIVDIDSAVKTAVNDADSAATELAVGGESVKESVAAAIARDQQRSLNVMATGRTVMLVLLTVGLAIGILVAVVLTRSINPPLESALGVLQRVMSQTTAAAGQITQSSQSLAQGANEQAASLEETSASLEELASMTKRNAEHAANAKTLAAETRGAADIGAADMQQMSSAMGDLQRTSASVANIVKTIDEIAFQTNILALNAAVEAARAGDAGAGFAVVAEEVRNLAQRSASAAKETSATIEEAVGMSERGAELSRKVVTSFSEILTKARQVDEIVGEIATASREQNEGIGQISTSVIQMDQVTQANASGAEENSAAAEELNSQAATLKDCVDELLTLVKGRAHSGQPAPAPVRPPAGGGNRLKANARDFFEESPSLVLSKTR